MAIALITLASNSALTPVQTLTERHCQHNIGELSKTNSDLKVYSMSAMLYIQLNQLAHPLIRIAMALHIQYAACCVPALIQDIQL